MEYFSVFCELLGFHYRDEILCGYRRPEAFEKESETVFNKSVAVSKHAFNCPQITSLQFNILHLYDGVVNMSFYYEGRKFDACN